MMKMFKTVLLAATLAAFGSSAFAGEIRGIAAEEVVGEGEILASSYNDDGFKLLVKYKSIVYFCSFEPLNGPWVGCYFID